MVAKNHTGHHNYRTLNSRIGRAVAESLETRRLLSAYGLGAIYKFSGGTDGSQPWAPLTAFNGLLYGTTSGGGADGDGNIFSVNPANNHVTTSVATFNGTNGYAPVNCALTAVGQNLYIASESSLTSPTKISVFNPASGKLSLFASFPPPTANASPPVVETMLDVGGNLYGEANRAVDNQDQSFLFECNVTTRVITPLVHFADDGSSPLVYYNGSLYGTGSTGIFQYNLATKAFNEHAVVSEPLIDGYYNGLTNVNGMFYGAVYDGGANNFGSLFQFNPATNKLTTLASFTSADAGPLGVMTYANGNLYGTAGGSNKNPAAFEYNIDSKVITPIGQFASIGEENPTGSLVDVNGTFYGTCTNGLNFVGRGAVFALVPAATIQLSSSVHNITLRVDPSYPNELEVLNGTTRYEDLSLAVPSVTILGDSSVADSVTVDYKSGGFFDAPITFHGAGSNNSLTILDSSKPGTHDWNLSTGDIIATNSAWSVDPTVIYNAVQTVGLTTDAGGDEIINVINAALAGHTLPKIITLNVTSNVSVDIRQTATPITVVGTGSGSSTAEKVSIGSLAPDIGGTLAGILAPVTVKSVSALIVDDSGDTTARTGTLSKSSVTGFGLAGSTPIDYSSVGQLTVRGGGGKNTETVTGTSATATTLYPGALDQTSVNVKAAAEPLTINGNKFVDIITIGSLAPNLGGTLANIAAPITVTNTSQSSTLTLDDSGDATARTGGISATKITGFGMGAGGAVNYTGSQLESVAVHGGSGANTDTVYGTSAPTTLYPGTSGASDVDVRGTTAALTINGNDKVDYITIGSLAPALGGTLTSIAGPITVTNTSAASTLVLDDSGDTTRRTGTLSATKFTGIGMGSKASVTYDGKQLASLKIHGGKAGGTLTETGTSTTTTVTGLTVKT